MNAIAYARFSPRPDGQKSESIEMQLERVRLYCAAQGWPVLSEFSDRQKSGATTEGRPGLAQAMQAACENKAVLVVYSLSRFSRSTRDAIELSEKLAKCGADLCSLSEKIDTTSPAGKCMFTIMAAIAQLERETTGARTSAAMLRKQANGERMSRFPVFGYKFEGDKMVADPTEQAAITSILAHHDKGLAANHICQLLTAEGHKPRGKKWIHNQVLRIIERAAV